MTQRDGRVTLLPAQIRRLAELYSHVDAAVEIVQYGSVLHLNDGNAKLSMNANGSCINNNPDQGSLSC